MGYRVFYFFLLLYVLGSCDPDRGIASNNSIKTKDEKSIVHNRLISVYLHSQTDIEKKDTVEFLTENVPVDFLAFLNDYFSPSSDREYKESEITIDTLVSGNIRFVELHKYTHGYIAFVHPEMGIIRMDRIWANPESFELLSFSGVQQDSLNQIKKKVMSLRQDWINDRNKFISD